MGARGMSASPPLRLLEFPTPSRPPARAGLSNLARAVMRLEAVNPEAAALIGRTVERFLAAETP